MNDIHIIKPVINVSVWDTQLPFVFLLLIVAGILFGILYIVRIRSVAQKNIQIKEDIPIMSSSDIVKEAIAELKKTEDFIENETFQELYLKITEIIKHCLTDVFTVNIKDMTTREVACTQKIPVAIRDIIIIFLNDVDRVKFDDIQTDRARAKEIFDLARRALDALVVEVEAQDILKRKRAQRYKTNINKK